MLIFQDVFTNDELLSDVYTTTTEYGGVVSKVQGTYKNKDKVGQVDIGKIN